MTVSSQLTADLRKLVLRLEDDLRERLAQDEENLSRWKAEHQGALHAQRTSSGWQAWRDDKITQAAVAWILTTVFVRFAEDNGLVRPVWISGPGARRQEALDAQIVFFRAHPELTDREWLLEPVEYLKKLPATADLVGEHSALWQVQPSGRMATELLEFWRQTDDAGLPTFDLADPELSTRFLGDLYQDLSEYAKKTFALLQTPDFVEEFILDQTMIPALAERSLEGFKVIDPTCGSGHFLLGAFMRLTDEWAKHAPGLDARTRVQKALDAVHGVDLNPFAVAIARFRLTVAAMKVCAEASLELAPAFQFHLAAGDSLLHGQVQREFQFEGFDADSDLTGFSYAAEDVAQLKRILKPGQYDAVVGNPPYITVKDKTLNEAYRMRYKTCKGTYALTIPFMERFFELAKNGSPSQPAGWTGQITSNSFMRREFGIKLIEEFLVTKDLQLVVDSEGAWIPGHNTDGTPTVILVGRNQRPVNSSVRAVLSKGRRESRSVGDNGEGPFWQSIVAHVGAAGFENDYISVADLDRSILSKHPWSLTGGSVPELRRLLSDSPRRLSQSVAFIGYLGQTNSDSAFVAPEHSFRRRGVEPEMLKSLVSGDEVRDYWISARSVSVFPYSRGKLVDIKNFEGLYRWMWPSRTTNWARATFAKTTYREEGRTWWEWHQIALKRMWSPLTLIYPNVSSHNHFCFDRDGRLSNPTAPCIKLSEGATEQNYIELMGALNSSVAAFWLKDSSQPKGGAADVGFLRTYQFTAASLQDFPLPIRLPLQRSGQIDELSRTVTEHIAGIFPNEGQAPTAESLERVRCGVESMRARMIAIQEELDWEMYYKYGLIDEDLTSPDASLPEMKLGQRAFEIALARSIAEDGVESEWFSRQSSIPLTEVPQNWPSEYRRVVERRLELIESDPLIRLLEKPEYKRRWATEAWSKQQERALREWLLSWLDDRSHWFDRQGRPIPRSVSHLADVISRDLDMLGVLSLWDGARDVDVVKALTKLLVDESVPYLAAHRLKDPGLRKRESWEETWELQRREDAGESVGNIPAPPKYTSADFHKSSWWRARGKLDVPKERLILYPDAGRSTDQTLLLGWAGWNHVEQFLALAAIMDQLVADGAPDEQLTPLVAGMGEVLPWVKQWHADIDPAYGVSMADFCSQQFAERAAQIDRSQDQLKAWRPQASTRGRRTKVTQ